MQTAEFLLGLAIVAVVFVDVFGSVLVPRPSHSNLRIGPAINRTLAPLWRRAAGMFPSARVRQDVRGSLGPAILVAALAFWVAALSLGFALMLHAMPDDVDIDRFGFSEALFQSTLAISTLGMIHADIHGWARAVVGIEGISGFSVVTLVVAFLLSIQSALHQREDLVVTFAARAGRPPSATNLIVTYADAVDEELATLFDSWEAWAGRVLQSHLSYPVLFRFRSLDENIEWLSCLSTMLDTAAVLLAADPAGYPRSRRAAGFLSVTGARAVREFARVLGTGDARPWVDRSALLQVERALERSNLAPATPAAFGERLDAIRAGFAGRLPLIAQRLDLAWCDTLSGGPVSLA